MKGACLHVVKTRERLGDVYVQMTKIKVFFLIGWSNDNVSAQELYMLMWSKSSGQNLCGQNRAVKTYVVKIERSKPSVALVIRSRMCMSCSSRMSMYTYVCVFVHESLYFEGRIAFCILGMHVCVYTISVRMYACFYLHRQFFVEYDGNYIHTYMRR